MIKIQKSICKVLLIEIEEVNKYKYVLRLKKVR